MENLAIEIAILAIISMVPSMISLNIKALAIGGCFLGGVISVIMLFSGNPTPFFVCCMLSSFIGLLCSLAKGYSLKSIFLWALMLFGSIYGGVYIDETQRHSDRFNNYVKFCVENDNKIDTIVNSIKANKYIFDKYCKITKDNNITVGRIDTVAIVEKNMYGGGIYLLYYTSNGINELQVSYRDAFHDGISIQEDEIDDFILASYKAKKIIENEKLVEKQRQEEEEKVNQLYKI